jgi:hypothetical protein
MKNVCEKGTLLKSVFIGNIFAMYASWKKCCSKSSCINRVAQNNIKKGGKSEKTSSVLDSEKIQIPYALNEWKPDSTGACMETSTRKS